MILPPSLIWRSWARLSGASKTQFAGHPSLRTTIQCALFYLVAHGAVPVLTLLTVTTLSLNYNHLLEGVIYGNYM